MGERMSGGAWPKYPPCASGTCTDGICCARGHEFRWMGLVGEDWKKAKAAIESDNPLVTVVVLPPGRVGLGDYCCNRVYLLVNETGKVFQIPIVG